MCNVQTVGPGMAQAPVDTCKTPTPVGEVPIPYPNMALNAAAIPACATITINMMPELTLMAKHPLTSGDEAGVGGGVVGGLFMGPLAMYMLGSIKVLVNGAGVILMGMSPTSQNGMNAPGTVTVPSQPVVMVMG